MRVNCHAHIFNLDSALSEGTLDIIRRRVVEAAVEQDIVNESISKRLGDLIGKRLAEKLAGGPRIDDQKFVRELLGELDQETGLLEEVAKKTSGLPGSFGDAIGGASQRPGTARPT